MINNTLSSRYRIIREIGKGGFSSIYEAFDTLEERPVAVKILDYKGDIERILRFRHEVAILSRLEHPHVVKVFHVAREDEIYYLVMELIKGVTLSDYLRSKGRLEVMEAVFIIIQAAKALDHVHRQGIIHRDIKPTNIMIIQNGEATAKILDFGFAWMVTLADRFASNSVIGTLSYMAPEQTGILQVPIDFRADLYALGVVFYELLTGIPPFKGSDAGSIIHQHIAKLPPLPRTINPDIPPILEEIAMKLLKKDPQDRYQTARGLIADLKKYQDLSLKEGGNISFKIGQSDDIKQPVSFYTKLIGREAVSTKLEISFKQAAYGKGKVIFIAGEPGIGKSRLVSELMTYVNQMGGIFISGKCNEYTREIPYASFVESIQEYVRQIDNLPTEKRSLVINRIKNTIGDTGWDVAKIIPEIKALIGEPSHLITLDQDKQVERFRNIASDFLISLASEKVPVLLFWDDLQWVDGGSLQLLERAIPKINDSNMLIIGAFRDNEVGKGHLLYSFLQTWKNSLAEIKLHSLSLQDTIGIVMGVLNISESKAMDLAKVIYERTAGNPFFTLEMIKVLLEKNILSHERDFWRLDPAKIDQVSISLKVDELILKKLDNLKEEDLEVLSYAAIIGRHFTFNDLLYISYKKPEELLEVVNDAIRYHIITPRRKAVGESGYTFTHDKILEALYARIDPAIKERLHQRIGEYLEDRYRDRINDVTFELALHFIQGQDKQKALRYSLKAGEIAKETYANSESAYFYETALKLMSDGIFLEDERDPFPPLRIKENLGDAYFLLGRYEEANRRYFEIRPYLTDKIRIARLETKIGSVFFRQGDSEKTLEHFGKGLSALGVRQPKTASGVIVSIFFQTFIQIGHTLFPGLFIKKNKTMPGIKDIEAMRLFESLSYYYFFIDIKRCVQVNLRHLNLAERVGNVEFLRIVYCLHQKICGSLGMHKRGLKCAMNALTLKEMTGQIEGAHDNVFMALGVQYYYMAKLDEAIYFLDKAVDEMMKIGNLWEAEISYGILCLAYYGKSQPEKIIEYATVLQHIAEGVKDIRGMGWGQALLALGYSCQGKVDQALKHAESAVRNCETSSDQLVRVMNLRILGEIYLKRGNSDKAIKILETSRNVIKRYQIMHEFVAGTYVVLTEAYLEAARAIKSHRKVFLKKAKRSLFIALILGKIFKNWEGQAYRVKGIYEAIRGNKEKAMDNFKKSLEVSTQMGSRCELAKTYLEVGMQWLEKDDRKGKEYIEKSAFIFQEVGSEIELEKARQLLEVKSEKWDRSRQEVKMGEQQALRTRLKLSSLLQVCQDISGVLDLEELLNQILDRAILVIGAERGYLLLYENGELEVKVAKGLEKEELGTKPFEFSRSLIMQVEKEGRPIVTIDAQADPRFKMHESVILYGLRSILCVPLKRKEHLLGILYMDNRLVSRLFTEEEIELMMAFGAQAAIAIDNASAYFQIAELNENLETKVQERTGELARVNWQLEESNKKLKEFDRLKTMFLSLVSHELRTPLTSIKGFAENMLDGLTGGLNNKQKDYLKRIKLNTDRLTRMINDLLDLSRIESGKMRLSPVELSPSEVAMEVVDQLKPLAAEKNLVIEIIAPDQAPKIWADQDKLNQIMINLLNNAIKFTPAGGNIRIETEFNDKDSFVCVHDNGVGISPEDLPKIFDPFFQVSRQAEEKVQGSGLGLTITKSLVELHGGKIWVKSEIGCGSEFAFTLPMKNQGVSN